MLRPLFFLFLYLWAFCAKGQDQSIYLEGQYIVQFKEDKRSERLLSLAKNVRNLDSSANLYLLEFDPQRAPVIELELSLSKDASVKYFMKNSLAQTRSTTANDSLFTEQWSLMRLEVDRFWDVAKGDVTPNGDSIVVAVIDNGFDVQHEDLMESFWKNKAEIPGDGIDNDSNGYIDDVLGANTALGNGTHDVKTHGSSVSGIISATSNNDLGVTGMTWGAKVMPISPSTNEAVAFAGLAYAYEQRKLYNETNGARGAFVVAVNMSFGFDFRHCEDFPIWEETFDRLGSEGILIIGATVNRNWDIDDVGDIPTSCSSDFLIAVTNSTRFDKKYIGDGPNQGAGYGPISIDLAAPGVLNYSTKAFDKYGAFEGTSSSTPHVAGAVALLYSAPCSLFQALLRTDPSAAALAVKRAILAGTDTFNELEPYTKTSGRLNVWKAYIELSKNFATPSEPLSIFMYPNPSNGMLTLELDAQGPKYQKLEIIDNLGRIAALEEIPAFCLENKFTIDLSYLAQGFYTLKISDGEETAIQTLIIL